MPINFSSIPDHIKVSIVEKQNVYDFIHFVKCSRESYNISKKIRTRIPFLDAHIFIEQTNEDIHFSFYHDNRQYSRISTTMFDDVPVRIIGGAEFKLNITSEMCERFLKFLHTTGTLLFTINAFEQEKITCSLEQFEALLNASRVKVLYCFPVNFADFTTLPPIRKLKFLAFESALNDEEFLALENINMFIHGTNVSNNGINVLLKQWLKGEREIKEIGLKSSKTFLPEEMLLGIPYSIRSSSDSYDGVSYIIKRGSQEVSVERKEDADVNIKLLKHEYQ